MRAAFLAAAFLLGGPSIAAAQTPLLDAARAGDSAAAIAAIDDADIDARDGSGATALIWAAHHGDAALARRLLREGADPHVQNLFGVSAMGEAAQVADQQILSLLLDAGVDPDFADREGQTPLMVVARTGRTDAARVLVDEGADVNLAEQWGGQTALMWAVSQSHPDMVVLLIEAGADVDARGAIRDWQRRVTVEPREKIMAEGGFTPLLYAAREGCLECARHLIEAGANIELEDPDRVTPLNLAIMNRHFDLARYLIEAGAQIDRWDFSGRTPLYMAVDMNTPPGGSNFPIQDENTALDIVHLLLDRGADVNIQLKHRPEYRQGVNERGADIMLTTGATPLLRAARSADLEVMRLLLDRGALVELPNQYGVTPFMVAAGVGFGVRATRGVGVPEDRRIAAMQMLFDAGADPNRRVVTPARIPPPGLETFLYRVRITFGNQRYLFSYVPPENHTAMHGAAMNGWTQAVRWLAGHGADIDPRRDDGLTPLDLAAGNYEPEILVPPADPFPETMAALEELCAARPGCSFAAEVAEAE